MAILFRFARSLAVALAVMPLAAQSPSFTPDGSFTGSSLAGWTQAASATWSASNGVITGKGDGLLVFSKPSQDTAVYLELRCEGDCNAGILLRSSSTSAGTKGLLLSIQQQELSGYRVTLDASGKITDRVALRSAGGQIRFAPPPPPPPLLAQPRHPSADRSLLPCPRV